MNKKTCLFSLTVIGILLSAQFLLAQNPISPPGIYIADPKARIWNDGKLYVYGSADESCSFWCSHNYHVLVTEDMQTWELVKNVFSSRGENDEVPYNDDLLFAPTPMYKDGTYFLYYCQPNKDHAQGVAVSNSPTGPFTGGQAIDVGEYNQIDPGIFIDDDGQAYYYWGQFTMKMAKMNDNMKELDMGSIRDSVLTEGEHFFHEGPFMTKINGTYYLVFSDTSRGDVPSSIGYATATNPFGPYTYRGVIIDNNNTNPRNWNNHGSIIEFNGQWYVFYHRSTHGCKTMRKAAVEPIEIIADGSIPEVEMTSQGAGGPIDARRTIQAEWACILNGNARIEQHGPQAEGLFQIKGDDRAGYKYIDFGDGVESVTIRVASANKGGTVIVSRYKPWRRTLAEIEVKPTENGEWQELTVPVNHTTGVHAVRVQFRGEDEEILSLDWFRFQ